MNHIIFLLGRKNEEATEALVRYAIVILLLKKQHTTRSRCGHEKRKIKKQSYSERNLFLWIVDLLYETIFCPHINDSL